MEKEITLRDLATSLVTLTTSVGAIVDRLDGMDKRFDGIDQQFDGIDQRFDGIDQRFDRMDARFDGIDQRFDRMDARFDKMDDRFDKADERFDDLVIMTKMGFDDQAERIEANTQAISNLDSRLVVQGDWICGIQKTMTQEFAAAMLGRKRIEERLASHDAILFARKTKLA